MAAIYINKKAFKYLTRIKKYPVNAETALLSYFKYYHRLKRVQINLLGCDAILFEATFYQRKLNIITCNVILPAVLFALSG